MKNALILFAVTAVLFISGCAQNIDTTQLTQTLPAVQQFMDDHPGSTIKTIYMDKQASFENLDEIREVCGNQMTAKNYYKVEVTSDDFQLLAYVDPVNNIMDCSIVRDLRTGEIVPPQQPENTDVQSTQMRKTVVIDHLNRTSVTIRSTAPVAIPIGELRVYIDNKQVACSNAGWTGSLAAGSTMRCDFGDLCYLPKPIMVVSPAIAVRDTCADTTGQTPTDTFVNIGPCSSSETLYGGKKCTYTNTSGVQFEVVLLGVQSDGKAVLQVDGTSETIAIGATSSNFGALKIHVESTYHPSTTVQSENSAALVLVNEIPVCSNTMTLYGGQRCKYTVSSSERLIRLLGVQSDGKAVLQVDSTISETIAIGSTSSNFGALKIHVESTYHPSTTDQTQNTATLGFI